MASLPIREHGCGITWILSHNLTTIEITLFITELCLSFVFFLFKCNTAVLLAKFVSKLIYHDTDHISYKCFIIFQFH